MTKTFTALLCALSVFTSKAITITQDIDWGLQQSPFGGFEFFIGDGNTRADMGVHAESDGLNFIPSAREGISGWQTFLERWLATKPNDAFTVRQNLSDNTFSDYSVSIADIFGGQYFIPTKIEYKTAMVPSDFGQLIFEGDYGQAPLPDGGNVAMMLGSVVAMFISSRSLRRRY